MKLQRVFEKLKKLTHRHILACAFLVLLAAIFFNTIPAEVKTALAVTDMPLNYETVYSLRDQIDKKYKNMLTFKGNLLVNKGTYINLNGWMAKLMGQRYMNQRVKLNNGHLANLLEKDTKMAYYAEQLAKVYERQKMKGKDFLLVLAPGQISKYEDLLPVGYADYSNQNADNYIATLREYGVPVLDMRNELYRDHISNTTALFTTDHYWKPETGFFAYQKIVQTLTDSGVLEPVDAKYTDRAAYDFTTYPDFFLGSSGNRTGIFYAGVDDFTVITPKFDTDLSVRVPSLKIEKTGSFSEVCLYQEHLLRNYFNNDVYNVYEDGNHALMQYQNANAPIHKKILCWGDSYSNVPCAFLPLLFETCEEVDLREYSGNFEEYYEQYDPDLIVVIVGTTSLGGVNVTYDFFGDSKS